MPSGVYEAFIPFSNNIADQLYGADFLPSKYERKLIMQSGSTELKGHVPQGVQEANLELLWRKRTESRPLGL